MSEENPTTEIPTVSNVEFVKLNETITTMKTDIDKLKAQMVDKVQKAVLAELESNLNNHSKLIESFSNKLCELQNNLNTFTQKPVTQIMIETIRRHLTEEIMANVTTMFDKHVEKTNANIESKHEEMKHTIQNAKRFAYVK
jgi:predicted transcriptional regulator